MTNKPNTAGEAAFKALVRGAGWDACASAYRSDWEKAAQAAIDFHKEQQRPKLEDLLASAKVMMASATPWISKTGEDMAKVILEVMK